MVGDLVSARGCIAGAAVHAIFKAIYSFRGIILRGVVLDRTARIRVPPLGEADWPAIHCDFIGSFNT